MQKLCQSYALLRSEPLLPPVNGTDQMMIPMMPLLLSTSVETMATISLQTIQEVIEQYVPFKRQGKTIIEVRQISDRELRKHLASEAALRKYELSKDSGNIASARSYFQR